ncbi:MAG: sulfite exporter TauE/SafE family protein [Thermoguttaceae bacterium]|jgi:uncharacterized membrane protein YfcA
MADRYSFLPTSFPKLPLRLMDYSLLAALFGISAAVLMGFSKTGLPGAATPAVALMAAAFPEHAELSVGAMLPLLLIGDVFAVVRRGHKAQWGRLWRLFPYVLLGMVPGYLVLSWLSGTQLRPVLGGLVLALLGLELARKWLGWNDIPERWWVVGPTGFLAGFSTIVGNAGGPVMSLYLLSQGLAKEAFIGTCAWFFFLLNLSKVIPFWSAGMLNRQTLTIGLVLGPVTLAGGLFGLWLLERISQRAFNGLMLILAGVAGLWLLAMR